MNARARSTLLLACVLSFGTSAMAQDAGVEEPTAEEEPKPERTPPTAGTLPYEDPTNQPTEEESLEELGAARDAGPEDEVQPSGEAESEGETATWTWRRRRVRFPWRTRRCTSTPKRSPGASPARRQGRPDEAPAPAQR